jgi:(1->4)-alpha-D-glucan 1-alpha-D-glucosylmutase
VIKALREAKVHTSWINTNSEYEDGVTAFINAITERTPDNQFLSDFELFQKKVSHLGMFNSLSQTLLKITCPGVPDFYQGTELWNFSLVDPDNRRPVDYVLRRRMLEKLRKDDRNGNSARLVRRLIRGKEDGRIKLYLTYRALNYRRENREIFESGEYIPLNVSKEFADVVCAFLRRSPGKAVLVAVPRFFSRLTKDGIEPPVSTTVWKDGLLELPAEEAGMQFRNVLTGEVVTSTAHDGSTNIYLAELFANLPVALLESMNR